MWMSQKKNVYSYQEVPQIILFTISSILNDIEWDKINTGNITNTHTPISNFIWYGIFLIRYLSFFSFCCSFKRQIKFLLFTKNRPFFLLYLSFVHYNRWWFYFSLFMFGHYLGFFCTNWYQLQKYLLAFIFSANCVYSYINFNDTKSNKTCLLISISR